MEADRRWPEQRSLRDPPHKRARRRGGFLCVWFSLLYLRVVLHPDDDPAILRCLGHERPVQTSGAGIGPKNIRNTFSLPITRTNSCTMQYAAIRTNRMIWIAQKCGHTISESNFSLPAPKP